MDTVNKCGKMIMNETLAGFTTFPQINTSGRYNSVKNSLSGRNPPGELLLMILFKLNASFNLLEFVSFVLAGT